jgi:chitin disaccharide deacetylase
MLIITADDYGKTAAATDRILDCFRNGRLTSASAMVFMEDSERAATLTREVNIEVGLHLNLTEAFTGLAVDETIRRQHARVARYLNRHPFAHALFNPWLGNAFRLLVQSQWARFEKLYGRPPDFVNGHHHMHLSANVLNKRLLPAQSRMRGPFTFKSGEKGRINRWYRSRVARRLKKDFIVPDCLYSIEPITNTERLRGIAQEARTRDIELETHPEHAEQHQFLLSADFYQLLEGVEVQGFRRLVSKSGRN